MIQSIVSKNGTIISEKEATIPLDNVEFTYGFGVYENIKVRKRILYFPEKHCERLLESAKYIGIPSELKTKEIQESLIKFIEKIKDESFNIKMLLVGNKESSDLYIMALAPKFIPKTIYNQGIKVITYKGERQFPKAKTLSMLQSYIAYKEAKKQDAYDALLVHENGDILEGTRTNLFFAKGNVVYTAPEENILNGVTRSTLIEALKKENIEVQERTLKEDEIDKYDGFFLTSTSAKVIPISQVNDRKITISDEIKTVIKTYQQFLENYEETQKPINYIG